MRVLVEIAYQGDNFLGFQIQQNGRTVQQQFEKLLQHMHKRHVRTHPSDRTDRGIHTIQQYFHFDTELNIPMSQWQYAMNRTLPDDIHVNNVVTVDDDLHCRYGCVGKRYRYKVYQAQHRDPFQSGLKTFIPEALDLGGMNRAAQQFTGTRNFAGLCSQKAEVESRVRTLYQSEIVKTDDGFDCIVTGSGFLYNMVHVLVALLIEVRKGQREVSNVPKLLESESRKDASSTVPAEGLYLEKICLDENKLLKDSGNDIKIHRKESLQDD